MTAHTPPLHQAPFKKFSHKFFKTSFAISSFFLAGVYFSTLYGQVMNDSADASPAPAPAPTSSSSQSSAPSGSSSSSSSNSSSDSSFLGTVFPMFDPNSEFLTWDGKSWNINNNRVFQARFEKYLNSDPFTKEDDLEYMAILEQILSDLAPTKVTPNSLDEAFKLLPQASSYKVDNNLCDTLANAIYSVWLARRENNRLEKANDSLEQELIRHERNARITSSSTGLKTPPKDPDAARVWVEEQKAHRELELQPYVTRAAEVKATILANQVKREASILQTKVEFQTLLLQLFTQRRYQHVLIGTRFYRNLFQTGDTTLEVGEDTKDLLSRSTGMPPTVATLDTLALQAVEDTRQGIEAYHNLLQKNELESASKRLAEAFVIGEYMPEIRTLSIEDKRKALHFVQTSNQLMSALEMKDFALAEKLVTELTETAKDFDASKPMGVIETAKTISAMHLAKARNAAINGDSATLENELKSATEIWPRNPALAEISQLIFSRADTQQQALIDLDQLLNQRNYRQIFDDQLRFIAATAHYPEHQAKLKEILTTMQTIETSILQSQEIARRGDYIGAWENLEHVSKQYPNDSKLNQVRADLTTQAADFVRVLRQAQSMEERGQTGSSLSLYLKAQQLYPQSSFAKDGVDRLVTEIMPNAS